MSLKEMLTKEIMQDNLEEQLESFTQELYGKGISECSNEELYYSILNMTQTLMDQTMPITGDKKVYYISAEFFLFQSWWRMQSS